MPREHAYNNELLSALLAAHTHKKNWAVKKTGSHPIITLDFLLILYILHVIVMNPCKTSISKLALNVLFFYIPTALKMCMISKFKCQGLCSI